MVAAGAITIAFALVVTAPVRRRMLGALGNLSSRESSAATVVQTMVRGDAIEAIRTAQAHFYCIRISALGEADMANNQDSGLFAKTDKASMGECDAFISHSWRDDPALKWQRMLEFKAEFESKSEGREPQCWLDKACIDQAGDIDASLKALPIFYYRPATSAASWETPISAACGVCLSSSRSCAPKVLLTGSCSNP